jgi:peptidoglycan L-alanyl-D-glutamate endopeptidase CwlK
MDIQAMIEAVQHKLGVTVDGRAGVETWGAIYAALVKQKIHGKAPEHAISKVDERSEKHIVSLCAEVQPLARALVHKAADNGIHIKVLSGLRTYQEQDALFAKGRTTSGNVVTKARGGYSNHNFGIAFDIGVFEGTRYLHASPKYKAVGVLGMELGLEWGGNWKTLIDEPHFQLRPEWALEMKEREMLAELRARVASNVAVYV